jgi:hypothetical protein
MPVPTAITDLNTTAANNSPPGTESAKGNIDDYLRAHAAFIAQTHANKAAKGANSDITSLSGLTTALSVAQGGTGGTTAAVARTALGAAALAGSSAQDFAAKNLTASGYMSSTAGDLNTVTAVNLADASATLTAAQLTGSKLFTITPTGNVTLTTDTAANIIAALTGYQVGSHVEFTIIVRAAFNVALAPGTGVTIVGETAVNQGSGTWKIRIDSASAVTIYNIGAAKTGLAAATQAEQEAGTSTAAAVTPGRQQYHPSAAKAWIKCDAAGVIQASHNITSITDDGVGLITVTIGTDFSSASYAVVASNKDDSTADQARITNITAQLAGAFSAKTVNHTPAKVDPVNWYFSCYGDQA